MFNENIKRGVTYMTAPNISARHGFTTRFGGVSTGDYASLNLRVSCGDRIENVAENYNILGNALDIDLNRAVFSRQVHKDTVRVCSENDRQPPVSPVPYEADALVTNIPQMPIMIFSADCTPILFHDPVKKVIGAAHAGWRGTVLDIAGKTVKKMVSEFGCDPGNICAAIGPCISQCCFETGSEVYNALKDILGDEADSFATPKQNGKFMTDLKGANRRLLEKAGVSNIEISEECTMCSHEKYWSHRITGEARGVQASVIVLD